MGLRKIRYQYPEVRSHLDCQGPCKLQLSQKKSPVWGKEAFFTAKCAGLTNCLAMEPSWSKGPVRLTVAECEPPVFSGSSKGPEPPKLYELKHSQQIKANHHHHHPPFYSALVRSILNAVPCSGLPNTRWASTNWSGFSRSHQDDQSWSTCSASREFGSIQPAEIIPAEDPAASIAHEDVLKKRVRLSAADLRKRMSVDRHEEES